MKQRGFRLKESCISGSQGRTLCRQPFAPFLTHGVEECCSRKTAQLHSLSESTLGNGSWKKNTAVAAHTVSSIIQVVMFGRIHVFRILRGIHHCYHNHNERHHYHNCNPCCTKPKFEETSKLQQPITIVNHNRKPS